MKRLLSLWLPLFGCTGGSATVVDTDEPDIDVECDGYPSGAAEPMALGEVLSPYRWPVTKHLDGVRETALDLANVPCAVDPEIDWSPFDVLLFVSIPAW